MTLPVFDPADLPPRLTELCELIGLPLMIKLVEHLGGTHLDVPSKFDDDSLLARLIGPEAAIKIIQHYSGERLNIAKVEYGLRVQRNIEISRRYVGGTSVFALAREYGLTERQIWNILKRPETLRESPQCQLF